jgi:multicomponent Na+:H+ antiporter subunit A
LYLGPVLLAVSGLIAELIPGFSSAALLRPASSAVLGAPDTMVLKLWHGLTPMLALTVVTVLAGFALFAARRRLRRTADRLSVARGLTIDATYDRGLTGLMSVARWQTRLLQTGTLRHYVRFVLVTFLVLTGVALWTRWEPSIVLDPQLDVLPIVVGVLVVLSAIATSRARSRLAAVAFLGVVGFGIAMLFFLYSGPDLAVTQFAVETLAVLLFVFVLYKLPRFSRFSGSAQRAWDSVLALAFGALMSVLVLAISTVSRTSRLASYYAESSVPEGKGLNVVNVILVDFRALDTLGEIAVLAISAIGVFALLRLRPKKGVQA